MWAFKYHIDPMSKSEHTKPSFVSWLKKSLGVRLTILGFLALLLLIPLNFAKDLLKQRENYQNKSINEVSEKWGDAQIISGPILRIPYQFTTKKYSEDGEKYTWETHKSNFFVLPDSLHINAKIEPEVRYRGVYEIVVYETSIKMEGYFKDFGQSKWENWGVKESNILWNEAVLEFSVGDPKGINSQIQLDWNGKPLDFVHGQSTSTNHSYTPLDYNHYNLSNNKSNYLEVETLIAQEDKQLKKQIFHLNLELNGSKQLQFSPVGKTTTASIESSWTSPSFDGAFLPKTRTIDESGFSAFWHVIHLNREFPQHYIGFQNLKNTTFGLSLFQPGNIYQMANRAGKYGFMIIALTLLTFFFFQLFYPIKVHSFQLFLIGLALCIFYALLIAFSERIAFSMSYLISSSATILLIVLFSWRLMKQIRIALNLGAILVLLYGVIYWLIQLEDPLLIGTLILFVILAILMALSSKINWYTNATNSK